MELTLGEILEFEFYFEVAAYLDCDMFTDLARLKRTNSVKFRLAAKHVLQTIVSPACRAYIEMRVMKIYRDQYEKHPGAYISV